MDTIVAVSTPYGTGGIAVVRMSGADALAIADQTWKGSPLSAAVSHTAHLGNITDESGSVLDQAVATVFRGPNSFTGEDTVEFSVHGSKWIQRRVVERLIQLGARAAEPGEFTKSAFLNRRLDLAQAEAVADLIASSSKAAHRLAMSQMSGSFSKKLRELRDKLIDLASLLELELDFSEEDVQFADRERLLHITEELLAYMSKLASTYAAGKAFKEGVPVVIAGRPNAGKSTLLNALLGDDKAIVSDVPGTTRDIIEDTVEINGVLFRFIDTAGLRHTTDKVEKIGIDRARNALSKAMVVIWLIDNAVSDEEVKSQLEEVNGHKNAHLDQKYIIAFNKTDLARTQSGKNKEDDDTGKASEHAVAESSVEGADMIAISAKGGDGIERLKRMLTEIVKSDCDPETELIVTNARHYDALQRGAEALRRAKESLMTGISADFIAQDIREAIHALGTLTGEITADHLLTTIFSRFCVGK